MKSRNLSWMCASLMVLAVGCSNSPLGQSNLAGEGGEGGEQGGVGICHTDGKGRYHKIYVSVSAITWLPEDGKWTGHPVAEVGDDGALIGVSFGDTIGSGGHHTGWHTGHLDLSAKAHPCECFSAAEGGPQFDPDREGCCGKEGAYCQLEDNSEPARSEGDMLLVKCCEEGLTCQDVGSDAARADDQPRVGKCLPEVGECTQEQGECWDSEDCCPGLRCYLPGDSDSGKCIPQES